MRDYKCKGRTPAFQAGERGVRLSNPAPFLAVLTLVGCTPQPCVRPPPQIVHEVVTRYVAIPAQLTAPVPLEKPKDATVVECVRVNIQRAAAIGQCNSQLDAIRKLQPQVP